jgi:oligopeptide transport system ATP-binding protein
MNASADTRASTDAPLLAVRDLSVTFTTPAGELRALRGAAFDIRAGEVLAVVGESGSGKTQLALALMGLLADNAHVDGAATWRGEPLLHRDAGDLNRLRGSDMAMIFQDPETTLNPYLTIGRQMCEVLQHHRRMARADARLAAAEMLHQVRIAEPQRCLGRYPHQLSGGMQQRVAIAMALLCQPALLIADEPTTALDVTVQADINRLMLDLRERYGTAILLITHDLGVVAGMADRVLVLYAGQIMELAEVQDLYRRPAHPYSRALVRAVPRAVPGEVNELHPIPGNPPNPLDLPSGCPFRDRCEFAFVDCTATPLLRAAAHGGCVACHLERLPE